MFTSDRYKKLYEGSQQLGIDIYRYYTKNNGAKVNTCISPHSAMTSMTLILARARGETENQLRTLLHLGGMSREEIQTEYHTLTEWLTKNETTCTATGLFLKTGFTPSTHVLTIASTDYQAATQTIDFEQDSCFAFFNDWVSKATHGKINSITQGFDSRTMIVVIHAIYFKALWRSCFEDSAKKVFHLDEQMRINTKFMSQINKFSYGIDHDADCKILELPYRDGKTSMVIFLPNQIDGIKKVEVMLSPAFITYLLASLKEQRVEVTLPVFHLEFTYNLIDVFLEMGLSDLFELGKANLSGIQKNVDLQVSSFTQKTFISVDEAGTEAAAVTSAMIKMCGRPPKVVFNANHPFLYLMLEMA